MFRSFQIIIREFRRSLLKLLRIRYLVRFYKQGVVAAYLVRCVLALRYGLAGVVWYPDVG